MNNFIQKIINVIRLNRYGKVIVFKKIMYKLNMHKLSFLIDSIKYKKKININFRRHLHVKDIHNVNIANDVSEYTMKKYLSHKFNVLGSGWINVNLNKDCTSHSKEDKYNNIDWHKDHKSGYRFDKNELSSKITFGDLEGVDVKVPWELSRMHHFPQMALSIKSLVSYREKVIYEFKNEVCDFLKNNPIGYGVNWKSTMDVSIRAVNLLIGYDLLKQQDSEEILDSEFEELFLSNIILHGRYIIRNLEINITNDKFGNHYLSNLCGLLFIASYINIKETRKWYEFARKELFEQMKKQFLDDGSNYECSTAYHRLSGELLLYSLGILIRNGENLDNEELRKVNSIAQFAMMITKPNQEIIQIGDNDSGRLLKINLYGKIISKSEALKNYVDLHKCEYDEERTFVENELTIHNIIVCAYAITKYNKFEQYSQKYKVEFTFFESLIGGNSHNFQHAFDYSFNDMSIKNSKILNEDIKFIKKTNIILQSFEGELENSLINYAPNFGLITLTNKDFKFFVRGVPHMHNDFLHFEFCLGKKNYFSDPGTYVYTSFPQLRNDFRSVISHNVPNYGFEPNEFIDIFKSDIRISGEITELSKESIEFVIRFKNIIHIRRFRFKSNTVTVEDFSNIEFKNSISEHKLLSVAYGMLLRNDQDNRDITVEQEEAE